MIKLSIIVPVYNVEAYLAKCLDSLLCQDIAEDEYEIIIVNDGSTDGSPLIAQQYAENHIQIQVITQQNKGLGGARNTGMKVAQGECLLFVDSDDYIQTNSLGYLLARFSENKLDVLRFNYIAVDESGSTFQKRKSELYSKVYSEEVVSGEVFLSEHLGWACYVWVYLFDKEFIRRNKFIFNEDIYFEDVEWLVRVLLKAQSVQSIDIPIYYYLQRSGSITKSTQLEKKHKIVSDQLYIIRFLKSKIDTTEQKKVQLWCKGMISLTFMSLFAFVENELPQRKKELIKLFYLEKFFPLKSYKFTCKQTRNLLLINTSPLLYCYFKRK